MAVALGFLPSAWLAPLRSVLPGAASLCGSISEADVAQLRAEVAVLRSELEGTKSWESSALSLVPCPILRAGMATAQEQGLWLDRGRAQGVRPGLAVVLGAALLGQIVDATEGRSSVRRVTDPAARLRVFLGRTGHTGLARGLWPSALEVVYCEREAQPVPGDAWFSTGEDDGLPRGLVLGYTREVFEGPDGFLRLLLEPACPGPLLGPVGIILDDPERSAR